MEGKKARRGNLVEFTGALTWFIQDLQMQQPDGDDQGVGWRKADDENTEVLIVGSGNVDSGEFEDEYFENLAPKDEVSSMMKYR